MATSSIAERNAQPWKAPHSPDTRLAIRWSLPIAPGLRLNDAAEAKVFAGEATGRAAKTTDGLLSSILAGESRRDAKNFSLHIRNTCARDLGENYEHCS